ncbi:helix-turn-helix domain-containing protein [Ramlibacter sp. AN1133]|uniref:helix-turn-helix domain-containing protein n=1 Tax=Ramlibacter sp. AN1133 TaxID=3133429 RepID=UPI0030C1314B
MQTAAATSAPVRFVPPATALRTATAPAAIATLCSTCHLKDLCLPCGLTGSDVERLDGLKFARRRVKEGEALYHEGDRFQFVYAVRSGTFKSTLNLRDGREQVTGFQIAGELLGLDGLASGKHASSAIALEDTEICAIPYAHLTELATVSPDLHIALSRMMSREIVREHGLMMLLGSMNAEQRLAAFLLNMSQRLKARGYSATEFHLRMMRVDIGSYLGMKLETVSRTFTAFQQQGLLKVDKKHVKILDIEALQGVFDGPVQ